MSSRLRPVGDHNAKWFDQLVAKRRLKAKKAKQARRKNRG